MTTTRVTHATPAALYSHSASRYWESDDKLSTHARGLCKDIARQLVEDEPGKSLNVCANCLTKLIIQNFRKFLVMFNFSSLKLKVILGGGRRHFMGAVERDPQRPNEFGRRLDNRNLIESWLLDKKERGLDARYVRDKSELDHLNTSRIDYLLGL